MENEDKLPDCFSGMSRKSPFTVPGGYFEQLPSVISGKLETGESGGKNQTMNLLLRPLPLVVAALLILALVAGVVPWKTILSNGTSSKQTEEIACISGLNSLGIEESDLVVDIQPENEQKVDAEAISDYLILENVDLELIASEY